MKIVSFGKLALLKAPSMIFRYFLAIFFLTCSTWASADIFLLCRWKDLPMVSTVAIYTEKGKSVFQSDAVIHVNGEMDAFGGKAMIRVTPPQIWVEYSNLNTGFSQKTTINRVTGEMILTCPGIFGPVET